MKFGAVIKGALCESSWRRRQPERRGERSARADPAPTLPRSATQTRPGRNPVRAPSATRARTVGSSDSGAVADPALRSRRHVSLRPRSLARVRAASGYPAYLSWSRTSCQVHPTCSEGDTRRIQPNRRRGWGGPDIPATHVMPASAVRTTSYTRVYNSSCLRVPRAEAGAAKRGVERLLADLGSSAARKPFCRAGARRTGFRTLDCSRVRRESRGAMRWTGEGHRRRTRRPWEWPARARAPGSSSVGF